jgi:DnaK suppressor protein
MDNDEIKKLILAEITKTEKKIEKYKEMTKPVAPDCAIGRVTRMDAINNKSVTELVLRQAQEKHTMLMHVLTLVGTPEFGKCRKCNAQIPLGRILISPESMLCVNCAI